MEQKKNLAELYEEGFLNPIRTSQTMISEKKEEEEDEKETQSEKKKKKKDFDPGAHYAESSSDFHAVYKKLMENIGGGEDDFGAESDDTFNYDDDTADTFSDDDRTFTLTELKAMTLGELADLISGSDVEDDFGADDEIPMESYGQGGNGREHGAQGTYDGKAKKAPQTTRVKANGDAKFDDDDTGYNPHDTEGSEGSEHGAQGTYDGKAKKAPQTTHVKGNGDADFGKSRTGYGKKQGEDLF